MNPTSNNKITGFSLLSPSVLNKDKNNLSVNASYHASIEFIQRAGIAAKLPMKTINTAIMIFLRYFISHNIDNSNVSYSINDICRCSLFSASKIEETPCRLRDIMNTTFKLTFPDSKLPNPNTTDWHQWKDRLIKLESIILNEINFEFNAVHPHQFVLLQCNELKTSINIAKLSWSICNDCMYSRNIMLSYEPHQISAAAIYFASEFLTNSPYLNDAADDDNNNNNNNNGTSPNYSNNIKYDGTKEPNWWRRFDIDDDKIQIISELIMDLYESPFVKFEKHHNDDNENKNNQQNEMSDDDDDDDDDDEEDLDLMLKTPPNKKKKEKEEEEEISDDVDDDDDEDNDIKM